MAQFKCSGCQASLKRDKEFVLDGGDFVIVRSGKTVTCTYCGEVYHQGSEFYKDLSVVQSINIRGDGNVVSNVTQVAGDGSIQIASGDGIAQASDGGVSVVSISKDGKKKTVVATSGKIGVIGHGARIGKITFD